MFCYKCGYQIPNDAQFCSKCGTALNATATTVTNNVSPESKELDREAIKIYLSNVLALECVISKLQNDWCEVDNSVKAFEATNYNKQFLCYDNRYAYIATSNETLSAAFLHCDLDKIKQKLDTIIEQQREIIINQRILIAQNAQMIEQNQQTLNRLASIEQNTERAAQYAEIASNNAEACAWISAANYIKN